MMFPTHILLGGFLSLSSFLFAPGYVELAVLSGMAAAVLPDIDMLLEHRKTLHRPFQFLALALFAGLLMLLLTVPWTVALFFGLLSVSAHGFSEILSSGKTLRPYQKKDDRAVYNHLSHRWIEPRRWVMAGSGRDLLVSAVSGAVLLYYTEGLPRYASAACLGWAVLYYLLNRKVKDWITEEYDWLYGYFQQI